MTLSRILKPSQVEQGIYPEGQTLVVYHYLNRSRKATMWRGDGMKKASVLQSDQCGVSKPKQNEEDSHKRANWHEMLGPSSVRGISMQGDPVYPCEEGDREGEPA